MRVCESILASLVWSAGAGACSPAPALHISFSAQGCGDVVRVLSASARQRWARSSGSRPRAPTSFGVGFVPLAALYPPRFAARASDAFSRAYPSTCAFRPCLAVYGPYSERERDVVAVCCGCNAPTWGFVAFCLQASAPGRECGRGALFVAACAVRAFRSAVSICINVRVACCDGFVTTHNSEVWRL